MPINLACLSITQFLPTIPTVFMFSPHVLAQLVELTANVTNAFTVALFAADHDKKKTLS